MNVRVVGDSPGLSEQSESEAALVQEYQSSQIFLNTSTISPIPTALLEAMSCGCAVVTTATCMIPEIIENGKNGFMSNDEDELRNYINMLLNDKELREHCGNNARETVMEKFSESLFIDKWNQVFEYAYGVI
jgi:glycosyltransferase involved in cell wall biosynthesis